MKEVTFKQDWDWRKGAVTLAFKKGTCPAPDEAIEAARAAGVLEEGDAGTAKAGSARHPDAAKG